MSKETLWITVAVTFAFASWPLAAMLSGGQILPGLPIAREPHRHLVFQNGYVKVYEVEVGPHSATLEHQHEYDNLFVNFGDAHLANRVTGKPATHVDLADLAVNFSREPYSHVIWNEADQPFRNITIELLRPQGELREFYPSLDSALAAVRERGTKCPTGDCARDAGNASAGHERQPAGFSWSTPHDGHNHLLVQLDKNPQRRPPRGEFSVPGRHGRLDFSRPRLEYLPSRPPRHETDDPGLRAFAAGKIPPSTGSRSAVKILRPKLNDGPRSPCPRSAPRIRRGDDHGDWLIIPQVEHARIAGELARAWDDERFFPGISSLESTITTTAGALWDDSRLLNLPEIPQHLNPGSRSPAP